jgi:hypothetical protein
VEIFIELIERAAMAGDDFEEEPKRDEAGLGNESAHRFRSDVESARRDLLNELGDDELGVRGRGEDWGFGVREDEEARGEVQGSTLKEPGTSRELSSGDPAEAAGTGEKTVRRAARASTAAEGEKLRMS